MAVPPCGKHWLISRRPHRLILGQRVSTHLRQFPIRPGIQSSRRRFGMALFAGPTRSAPGRAPPHWSCTAPPPAFRRDRRSDAPARHPQRQRGDEQATHRRGEHHASRMISDPSGCSTVAWRAMEAPPSSSALPIARDLEEAAGHGDGRGLEAGSRSAPASIAGNDRTCWSSAWPRQHPVPTTWRAWVPRASTSPRSTTASPSGDQPARASGLLQEGQGRAVHHGRPHRHGRRAADQHPWRPCCARAMSWASTTSSS